MNKNTKYAYAIAFVAFLGLFTLFIFPEPETNFLAYAATALTFIIIIFILIKKKKKISAVNNLLFLKKYSFLS